MTRPPTNVVTDCGWSCGASAVDWRPFGVLLHLSPLPRYKLVISTLLADLHPLPVFGAVTGSMTLYVLLRIGCNVVTGQEAGSSHVPGKCFGAVLVSVATLNFVILPFLMRLNVKWPKQRRELLCGDWLATAVFWPRTFIHLSQGI